MKTEPNIIVPPEWNAEKDHTNYVYTFGDSGEPYYPEATARIRSASNELGDVLAFVVQHLAPKGATASDFRALSLNTQIEVCKNLIAQKTTGEVHERIMSDLNQCSAVLGLRENVLAKHVERPEAVWLFELGAVSDWLVTAWSMLLESSQIELGLQQDWQPSSDTWLDWYE